MVESLGCVYTTKYPAAVAILGIVVLDIVVLDIVVLGIVVLGIVISNDHVSHLCLFWHEDELSHL